jgi:hypothetical protein
VNENDDILIYSKFHSYLNVLTGEVAADSEFVHVFENVSPKVYPDVIEVLSVVCKKLGMGQISLAYFNAICDTLSKYGSLLLDEIKTWKIKHINNIYADVALEPMFRKVNEMLKSGKNFIASRYISSNFEHINYICRSLDRMGCKTYCVKENSNSILILIIGSRPINYVV